MPLRVMVEFRSKLDYLADHDCTRCELNETTERVCVMGRGDPKSRLMIIGEAPGGNEERTGLVFSGKAGQLLDSYLKAADLEERRPYITNVVKCRPPDNRTPNQAEWESCSKYLRREIKAVRPTGVFLLGNVALRAIWGKSGITKHRGVKLAHTKRTEALGLAGCNLMASIHPAYVLRNPGQSSVLSEDFKRFRRLIDGTLQVRDVKVKLVTTEHALRRVCAYLAKQPILSYDVENRYAPWDGKEWYLICLGISADGETSFVIPLRHPDSPFRKRWRNLLREHVKPILEQRGTKLVAQSGKHDNIQLAGASIFAEHTFDVMLAAHLLDENRPKNLGFLSQTLLGADVYKGMVETKPEKILNADFRTLLKYNGYDVGYTRQLYEPLRAELLKQPRLTRLFVKLMMPASHTMQQVEYRGMYINQERLTDRITKTQAMIEEKLELMAEYGAKDLNPNSTQQVGKWLFSSKKKGGLGLEPIELTKTGFPSTREGVLLHYRDHPAVAALLRYRTLQLKWMSTYLLNWSGRLDARNRIHTFYKLYGTVTGRLSGDMQQVPRDPFIRSVFGAPTGWRFIQADYSQIELRIAAHCSHERRMIRAFLTGEDLHAVTASSLTGLPVSTWDKDDISFKLKEHRKRAKAVNFGFLYGMYPKKFQLYAFENYDLTVSLAEAEAARARYFKMFPDLLVWHRRVERVVRSRGYVQSPLGRVRHLPDVYSGDSSVSREAVRQAINSPVQGTASDLMLFGMVQLQAILDPTECFMVGTLHDGIFFECKEDKVDKWAPIIKETLENLPLKRTFGLDMSVPIISDVESGQHWGEADWHL